MAIIVLYHKFYISQSGDIDKARPLLNTDASGNTYAYALNPLTYSVFLILVLELLERFSFYGVFMTQTNYLTGSYSNDDWYADLTSMDAASLVSLSTAVAYTVPFLGGILADKYFGDYKTIFFGVIFFYLPGLFVIASSTTPNWLLGTKEFNLFAYKVALLFLWPMGSGTVKAVVNVFGARQFHPVLQRSLVESFYVQFYMIINVGAVVGCIIIPVVARTNVTAAYTIPFILLLVAVICFVAGSKKYVTAVPGLQQRVQTETTSAEDIEIDDTDKPKFVDVAKICGLIIPFNVIYVQLPTTFMVQGAVMRPFGFIEAPSLDILDSLSVLVSGYFVSTILYPYLAKKGIKLPTSYKFSLGCLIGAFAILYSLIVEHLIHAEYARSGGQISVLWQAPSYALIGLGEIFSISTAYEVAFTASPPNRKGFACAFNLFFIGGLPNMVSLGLYKLCDQWFRNGSGKGNIGLIKDYSEAHVGKYFCLLFGIVMLGVVVNSLPSVREWIAFVEDRAALASSGKPSKPQVQPKKGEDEPLLKTNKHMKYLEEGEEAHIYRANTMKAEYNKKN